MKVIYLSLLVTVFLIPATLKSQEKITFPSKDGLEVIADLYQANPKGNPFIILFHQAGWSRGEYAEIAPKLNDMGFNCLAVDQRSGGKVNGVINQTHENAKRSLKETAYLDAYQDMEAATALVKERYAEGKVILWGSSYSSSLVLKYAGDYPRSIDGALAFSPGEYFKSASPTLITASAKKITVPVFITSAKSERESWQQIYDAIVNEQKQSFLPETSGNHGSRALWAKFPDHRDYWKAVNAFLEQFL